MSPRITYPAWRRLPADTRGMIAVCDTCAFWRRYIVPCREHAMPAGTRVTVTDGGWPGIVERADMASQTAWIRFPDHPGLVPYAHEALTVSKEHTS